MTEVLSLCYICTFDFVNLHVMHVFIHLQTTLKKNQKKSTLKKIKALTGFEPMSSVIPVQCSTNQAMKPHIGSEVNPLSPHLP